MLSQVAKLYAVTDLRRFDGTLDLDAILEKLRHLIAPGAVSDPKGTVYIAHELLIDRGALMPINEAVETYAELFSDKERVREELRAPLETGHVRIVVLSGDGVRIIQLFSVPLVRGGSC